MKAGPSYSPGLRLPDKNFTFGVLCYLCIVLVKQEHTLCEEEQSAGQIFSPVSHLSFSSKRDKNLSINWYVK